jgi:hypothetical protein
MCIQQSGVAESKSGGTASQIKFYSEFDGNFDRKEINY